MKTSRMRTSLLAAVILLLVTFSTANAQWFVNPGVLPPESRLQGLTYGGWIGQWWHFGLALPAAENPLVGATGANCAQQRVGNVALVIATPNLGEPIQCEVPAGTAIFIEVLGAECSTLEPPPFFGADEEQLRACAFSFVPSDLMATVDGMEIHNLSDYIAITPLIEFTLPDGNVFGLPEGTTGESVGYGAYLMLAPLSPGVHTIHTMGTYQSIGFTAVKNFSLTVTK